MAECEAKEDEPAATARRRPGHESTVGDAIKGSELQVMPLKTVDEENVMKSVPNETLDSEPVGPRENTIHGDEVKVDAKGTQNEEMQSETNQAIVNPVETVEQGDTLKPIPEIQREEGIGNAELDSGTCQTADPEAGSTSTIHTDGRNRDAESNKTDRVASETSQVVGSSVNHSGTVEQGQMTTTHHDNGGTENALKEELEGESSQAPGSLPATEQEEYTLKPTRRAEREQTRMESDKRLTLPGLVDPTSGVAVTFHALIPTDEWGLQKDEFSLHLRFGDACLGCWKENVGQFTYAPHMVSDSNFVEMICTLNIDVEILRYQANVPYKYCVIRCSSKSGDYPSWEILHHHTAGTSSGFVNRCLKIPVGQCNPGDSFHRYDTTVLPQKKKSMFAVSVASKAWKTFQHKVMKSLSELEKLRYDCLHHHLSRAKSELIGGKFSTDFSVINASDNIWDVFEQIYNPRLLTKGETNYKDDVGWECPLLCQEFCSWLLNIADEVDKHTQNEDIRDGQRLIPAAVVVRCLYNLATRHKEVVLDPAQISTVMDLLRLNAHDGGDYAHLLQSLHNDTNQIFFKAVKYICISIMKSRDLGNPEWLYVIPLIHHLGGYMEKPHPTPQMEWRDPCGDLQNALEGVQQHASKIHEIHWKKFAQLAEVDPHFRVVLAFICPLSDIPQLVEVVPPALSMSCIARILATGQNVGNKSCFKAILKQMKEHKADDFTTHQLDASQLLLKNLQAMHKSLSIDIATLAISITLFALSEKQQLNSSESNLKNTFEKIGSFVTALKQSSVVGIGFGGADAKKAKGELKFWNSLLLSEFPKDEQIVGLWLSLVQELMEERVQKMEDCRVLIHLELHQCHDVAAQVVVHAIIRHLQEMMAKGNTHEAAEDTRWIYERCLMNPERIGEILEALLQQQYPNVEEQIGFEALLEWDLWPLILNAFANPHKGITLGMTQYGTFCNHALTELRETCAKLESGTIEISTLELIQRNMIHVKSLFEAAALDRATKNKWKSAITSQSNQLKTVLQYRSHLKSLAEAILKDAPPSTCLSDLIGQVRNDLEKDDMVINIRVSSAGPLNEIAPFFSALKMNPIFYSMWVARLEANAPQSLSAVSSDCWNPTLEHCRTLLIKIQEGAITITELYKELHLHCKNPEILERDLDHLDVSLPGDFRSVSKYNFQLAADALFTYHRMCCCERVAQVFLEMKNHLKLGDFNEVEKINEKHTIESRSIMDLQEYIPSVKECLDILMPIAETEENISCLKSFLQSQELIRWFKEEPMVADSKQLNNFVDIAVSSTSGGEDEFKSYKLNCLQIVGTAFEPLIWQLKTGDDYHTLARLCQPLWEHLQSKRDLPKLLVACNANIEWYKMVKDHLGDTKRTTKDEFESLEGRGKFVVKSEGKIPLSWNWDEMVSLIIVERERIPEEFYSCRMLDDFQNRLALVAGHTASWKPRALQFSKVFHCVCQIAKKVLVLQKAGNVQYIPFKMEFMYKEASVEDLTELEQEMENELTAWKKQVTEARSRYYPLNYYTSTQLLILRKELGKQRRSLGHQTYTPSPTVISLLQSIAVKDICSSIAEILPKLQEHINEEEYAVPCSVQSHSQKRSPRSIAEPVVEPSTSMEESTAEHYYIDQLKSEHEMTIFTNVCKRLKYSQALVYEAIVHCRGEDLSQCSVGKWCLKHKKQFHGKDATCTPQKVVTSGTTSNSSPLLHPMATTGGTPSIVEHHPAEQAAQFSSVTSVVMTTRYQRKGITIATNTSTKSYLDLDEIGVLLKKIEESSHGLVPVVRSLPPPLTTGSPNVIITSSENVLRTTLAVYLHQQPSHSLPTNEEVLICDENTTHEEIDLFWRRALRDPHFMRIFTLVHAEKLQSDICTLAVKSLRDLCEKADEGYKLLIVCSNEDDDNSVQIKNQLREFQQPFSINMSDDDLAKLIKEHLVVKRAHCQLQGTMKLACSVDPERSCVRIVSSKRSGMGKSLYIRGMASSLGIDQHQRELCTTISVYGPDVTSQFIMNSLVNGISNNESESVMYHFDISPKALPQMDSILFSLLILKALSDGSGRIWRCLPSQLYVVETTIPELQATSSSHWQVLTLLRLLPTVECQSPREVQQSLISGKPVNSAQMFSAEFHKPGYKYVFEYLRWWRQNWDQPEAEAPTAINESSVSGTPSECLQVILDQTHFAGVDPSWREVGHFVHFLKVQLENCDKSHFCRLPNLFGLKAFAIKFMVIMAKDFANSSLCTETERAEQEVEDYDIRDERRWKKSAHPYLFFNEDRDSLTLVGFRVTPSGDLIDPETHVILYRRIMTETLLTTLEKNRINLLEDYRHHNCWANRPDEILMKLARFMGNPYAHEYTSAGGPTNPDDSYVLNLDNMIKILAILTRFRCNMPVILMGETGCGKTRLIRYMCDLLLESARAKAKYEGHPLPGTMTNMLILKVHGGTTTDDVAEAVTKACDEAWQNKKYNVETILFFDEANTSEAVTLIKEVLCDGRCLGKPIRENIKFVAACNPYKRHTNKKIRQLESAGLGFYVRESEKAKEKLGNTPLRHLVYRVLDLPPSMRPLVYDFGTLEPSTEQYYTGQIVKYHIRRIGALRSQLGLVPAIAFVLTQSQNYMRMEESTYVSMRDVTRAMMVFTYFYKKRSTFERELNKRVPLQEQKPDWTARSLILALAICYRARVQDRRKYEEQIVCDFKKPLSLPGGAPQFSEEIRRFQDVLLDGMEFEANVAKNAALRENVLMMVMCIELRIPVFIIGKPGSSKSLAKSAVAKAMKDSSSSSEIIKTFKKIKMFSCQCSKQSTPESIIAVFKQAKESQKDLDTSKFVSVVVLDEIGLAEDSPQLPLKVLHPELEDGTSGADVALEENPYKPKVIDQTERVAFVGISNWALDPAKMNRGVIVIREVPSANELIDSARAICSKGEHDQITIILERFFEPLATAYEEICALQERDFFGLRDFYSLIKMLYWMVEETQAKTEQKVGLTYEHMEHAILRNFGGYETSKLKPFQVFRKYVDFANLPHAVIPSSVAKEDQWVVCPPCSPLELVETSLRTKELTTTSFGDNRYLLFLTEDYAALRVLQHYLSHWLLSKDVTSTEEKKPYIMFGSSFPKDEEYIQVWRTISDIKVCMETGRTLILLNFDTTVYESLYDALNQHYVYLGEKRFVDLGLHTYRMKCHVSNHFKLIMIAEKTAVYERFPTALISRMEKHIISTEMILSEREQAVLEKFREWISDFSCVEAEGRNFTECDAFMGYQGDTAATVLLHAAHEVERQFHSLGETSPDEWEEKVVELSQHLLLQTACPDALARLKHTKLKEQYSHFLHIYCSGQCHFSLETFLKHCIMSRHQLLQVTTHGSLLKKDSIDVLKSRLDIQLHCCEHLQSFATKDQFVDKLRHAVETTGKEDSLIIIQCSNGYAHGKLITCARYFAAILAQKESVEEQSERKTFILFIIQLPRKCEASEVPFASFQPDYACTHIDDVCYLGPVSLAELVLSGQPLSSLFHNPDTPSQDKQSLYNYLYTAASLLRQSSNRRSIERVRHLHNLLQTSGGKNPFHHQLMQHVHHVLKEGESIQKQEIDIALEVSLNMRDLQAAGTFEDALRWKVDNVVIPIFAGIIALVDQNCNLNLIVGKELTSACSRLWLRIFGNSQLCKFRYKELCNVKSYWPAMTFGNKFPFSWLVFSTVKGILQHLLRQHTGSHFELYKQLHALVEPTHVGKVLQSSAHSQLFYCDYQHDFVRTVYLANSGYGAAPKEYKLLEEALGALVTAEFGSVPELLGKICALHVVFITVQSEIMWFGHLVSLVPGIIHCLPGKYAHSSQEMSLHIQAADAALTHMLENIAPLDDEEGLRFWLQNVQSCQNCFQSILSLSADHVLASQARLKWQRVHLLQLFLEDVCLKHRRLSLEKFASRLYYVLEDANFHEGETLQLLNLCLDEVRAEDLVQSLQMEYRKEVENSCDEFYVDILTNVFFGGGEVPESSVIQELLETIFSKNLQGTGLSCTEQDDSQPDVKIGRLLLQLLLENSKSNEQMHQYLDNYLKRCLGDSGGRRHKLSLNICLPFIQCCEDAFYKQLFAQPLKQKVAEAASMLTKGHKEVKRPQPQLRAGCLEAIARVRAALSVTAEVLRAANPDPCSQALLAAAQRVCQDQKLNSSTSGPAIFLFTALVHKYGFGHLRTLGTTQQWLLPAHVLGDFQKFESVVDPFVIYSLDYTQIRDHLESALSSQQRQHLNSHMKKLAPEKAVMLLFAYFEKFTLSQARLCAPKQEVLNEFQHFAENCTSLHCEFQSMATSLVANTFVATPPTSLQLSTAQAHATQGIVLHAVVVTLMKRDIPILQPLVTLLLNPDDLQNPYLPVFPDNPDALQGYEFAIKQSELVVLRSLSPASAAIFRMLIHSLLLYASNSSNLAAYFWQQVQQDLCLIEKAISRNQEETTLLMHQVLKEIMKTRHPSDSSLDKRVFSLQSQQARDQWEDVINATYIQPVLQNLDRSLYEALNCIIQDDKQELSRTLRTICGSNPHQDTGLPPDFWQYRPPVTQQSLLLVLLNKQMQNHCAVLFNFLQKEPQLRATQYLYDIVQLQKYLADIIASHQTSHKQTIGELCQQMEDDFCSAMFTSMKKAWHIVKEKHQEVDQMLSKILDEAEIPNAHTSLECLLPAESGPGASARALVEFLVKTHNSFLLICKQHLKQHSGGGGVVQLDWPDQSIPLTQIQKFHLLDYEQHLPSTLMSHCHCSVRVGEPSYTEYDLPRLERHFLRRFVYGKPEIDMDFTELTYHKTTSYIAETVAEVRRKIPVEAIPAVTQQEIISDLQLLQYITRARDVVETVLGFLASGGGDPQQQVSEYIANIWKVGGNIGKVATQYCKLCHIIPLWRVLSAEVARQLTLNKQNPFDLQPEQMLIESQHQALDVAMISFKASEVLGLLYEFIQTYLIPRLAEDGQRNLRECLRDAMMSWMNDCDYLGLIDIPRFESDFPGDITVGQVVAVWEYIVIKHAK